MSRHRWRQFRGPFPPDDSSRSSKRWRDLLRLAMGNRPAIPHPCGHRFEQPDRDARANDAGGASANGVLEIDARISVRRLKCHQRQEPDLITLGEMQHRFADILEGRYHGGRISQDKNQVTPFERPRIGP